MPNRAKYDGPLNAAIAGMVISFCTHAVGSILIGFGPSGCLRRHYVFYEGATKLVGSKFWQIFLYPQCKTCLPL